MDTVNRGRPAICLLLTSVAFFMVALDALVVVTALPAIHRSVGGSLGTLEWAVNAYGLTFAAGMITAAALGDRLGRRRVYVAGLALFSLASAACALAPTADTLIAARVVQGLGAAAVTPLSLTILTSTFPAARRGAVVGIWGGIAGLAIAGGPLATGLRLLPWTATPMLVAPLSGAVADRIGTRPLMAAGLALQAGGLGWVAWLASASGGYGRFVLPMIIAGVGISMALPTVATAALGAVAPPDMGRASGVNNTLQRFGGAFGIAVAAAVFSAHGQLGSPAGVTAGFRPALAVSALLSLLGAVAAVLAGRRGGARAPAAEAAVPA